MILLVLNSMLFLYVFGVFIFSKVEGLSLATNVAMLGLLVILAVKCLKTGLVGLRYALIILPLVLILFLSIFWSRYQVEASISFLSFLTASVGGIAVMLSLLNGASPKTIFWSTLLGSSYLVYSAWQERTVLMLSRVAGLAGNANDLAITLIIAGILISIERISNSYWSKSYALFLLIFSVYVTGSRKTLLILPLIPLLWLFQIKGYRLTKEKLKKIFILIGAIGIFVLSVGSFVWSSFTETATYKRAIRISTGLDFSANIRKEMILDGLELWSTKPILGYGINQYRYKTQYNTYSHNNYIEMLINGGLCAFFAYYFIIITLAIRLYLIKKSPDRFLLLFALAMLLLWDMAGVYYYNKTVWIFLSYLLYVTCSDKIEQSACNVKGSAVSCLFHG